MAAWLRHHDDLQLCGDLAIAVSEPQTGQRHVGVYYRRNDDSLGFLHLAFHRILRSDDPRPPYRWISPAALDEALQRFFATVCRSIANMPRDTLPYGFGVARFDRRRGTFRYEGESTGLTCATFVLAVFAAYEIDLVAVSTWVIRDEDVHWQRAIVEQIRQAADDEDEEHVRAIERDVGRCVRVRPEEVAGAASAAGPPVAFAEAAILGGRVVEVLRAAAEDVV